MKLIGFLGAYDKTNLILYIAKMLTIINKKVLIIDTTVEQKSRYIIPTITPTVAYVTTYEEIDIAIGFDSYERIAHYIGTENLNYDYILIDVDNSEAFENFKMLGALKNYFVTSFSRYSIRKGIETIENIKTPIALTKVLFTSEMPNEENDYLEYLTQEYPITWNDFKIVIPLEGGDQTAIIDNEKISRIRFKNLSQQFRDGLFYITEEILEENEIPAFERALKNFEKGE